MIQLVIFDLDGTLLNTLDDLAYAANAALASCGFASRSLQEVQAFIGNGVEKLLFRTLPDGQKTPENLARMKHAFLDYYFAHLWEHTHPYDGITEVLTALQTRGIQLAVASNKYFPATEKLLTHFFAHIPFVAVLGQQEGVALKPDPAMVHTVLLQAHVKPENALYVGDSDVDMQTAHNAGVHACGALWGFRPREVLQPYHPEYLIETPRELLSVIP